MSMIFKNYRDLINYVLSHYPYEKILTYTRDLHLPWRIVSLLNDGHKRYHTRYPRVSDIKKYLVVSMSWLCFSDINSKSIEETEDNRKISRIGPLYSYINSYEYIKTRFIRNRTALKITYDFEFHGKYRKYVLPHYRYRWGNKRTEVIFKFSGDQII